jgi:hypothetical protein
MMRSEAIGIIKRGMGFRQTQDVAIIAALKQAQRDAELGQTLPNWLLAFDQTISVVANTGTATFPTGFLRLHDDYPPYYLNSSGAKVFLARYGSIEAYTAYVASGAWDDEPTVSDSGHPNVFVQESKTRLTLVPTPTTSFTLYLTAYKAADVLDSDIENKWLQYAPNYIVGMAGLHVAGDVRDKGAAEKFSLMAKMGGKAFLGDIVEDELAGRPLMMGRNN